jgi:hypothetical protein
MRKTPRLGFPLTSGRAWLCAGGCLLIWPGVVAATCSANQGPGRTIRSLGIHLSLPEGWHGRIYTRSGPGGLPSVIQVASFPLPAEEDDGATAASRMMRRSDVLIVGLEFPSEQAGHGVFREVASHIAVHRRDLKIVRSSAVTHSLARKRATISGRPFSFAVEFGMASPGAARVQLANHVLTGIMIQARPELNPGIWSALRRPLHLPKVSAACPRARSTVSAPHARWILGKGPVYPELGSPEGFANLRGDRVVERSYRHKTLWAARPSYRGPFVVRGRRVDAAGSIGFVLGRVQSELRIPGLPRNAANQWRYVPTTSALSTPGCYAFQVDGTSFSTTVVFEAR